MRTRTMVWLVAITALVVGLLVGDLGFSDPLWWGALICLGFFVGWIANESEAV